MDTIEQLIARSTLARRPPEHTFRFIAMCATDAAELYAALDDPDLDVETATAYRQAIIDAAAAMFTAVVHAHPDAKWRLGRGLDRGQRGDV